jgi:hypothetical protein
MPYKFSPRKAVRSAFRKAGKTPEDFCPYCGASESHPTDTIDGTPLFMVLVRGYKVCDENGDCWSQCLVCASAEKGARGGYDKHLVWHNPFKPAEHKTARAGWFK